MNRDDQPTRRRSGPASPKVSDLPSPHQINEEVFEPNEDHRRCKAAFFLALRDNPICDRDSVTVAAVQELTGSEAIVKWWKVPGFRRWFCEDRKVEEGLELAAEEAVATLREVMMNRDASDTARVNAAKLSLEAAGKMPGKGGGGPAKDSLPALNSADREEVVKVIEGLARRVGLLPGSGTTVNSDKGT